jgi:hypothetical protein
MSAVHMHLQNAAAERWRLLTDVAVERLGGVGEPERAGPLEDARRPEAAGEEDELDIGAEVDDVEGERGGARADLAGSGGVALLARRALASQIARVACQVLGLHSKTVN